ncbi:MAG: glycosyltransferase [Pseudodesulfovibrio sp.]
MKVSPTPIALFCYNRPDHLRRTLAALRENHGVERAHIYAFSDGPKDKADAIRVEEVRELLASIDWCESVEIIAKSENCGLRASILTGVERVLADHARVIVLEDDLVTSPWFLTYMTDALDRYAAVPEVMHISGFFLPVDPDGLPETVFYRPTSCWGWATWKDRWEHIELDAATLIDRLEGQTESFNLDGAYNFLHHLQLNLDGKISTWAIFWYASVFLTGGQCLHPSISLTNNIGHDGAGTNCQSTNSFEGVLRKERVVDFPNVVEEHEVAFERARQFYLCNEGSV